MRNIDILVDFDAPSSWEFSCGMACGNKVRVLKHVTNTKSHHDGPMGNMRRFAQYFIFPLRYINTPCPAGTVILAWQQFFGLNCAFWSQLLRRPKQSPLVVMTFIYNPKRGLIGKIYKKYVKRCLTSGYIDKVLCYSAHECDMYASEFDVPRSMFGNVRLGIDRNATGNAKSSVKGDYVFAAGRSNRDYDFLIESLGADYDIQIACPGYKIPSWYKHGRVKVLDNCFGDEMYRVLSKSLCAAIPLDDENISSGQLSILQAMSMGKPVVATANRTVEEYIDNGRDGLVVAKTPEAMLQAVDRLATDNSFYGRISATARRSFESRYTENALARTVNNLIAKL